MNISNLSHNRNNNGRPRLQPLPGAKNNPAPGPIKLAPLARALSNSKRVFSAKARLGTPPRQHGGSNDHNNYNTVIIMIIINALTASDITQHQSHKLDVDDGMAWSKRAAADSDSPDNRTAENATGGSTGLKSLWLTPTPASAVPEWIEGCLISRFCLWCDWGIPYHHQQAMGSSIDSDTQWADRKETVGITMSSTGDMSRTFSSRKITVVI